MKVVILAGGFGSRISEESEIRPKPMIEIGGKPILWHIMKMYSQYGHNEFIVLLGYKGYCIKEYFANYFLHQSDVTFDLKTNQMEVHNSASEPWKVTLVDTGLNTMTGGRIKRAEKYIKNETFLLTYGDGLADVDINKTIDFHNRHGKALTLTAVQPESKFGNLEFNEELRVDSFIEKSKDKGGWINGGFFVCGPTILNYLSDKAECVFEQDPLVNLTKDKQLFAYRHTGFWHCMDTLRDNKILNKMWDQGDAKWKNWKD